MASILILNPVDVYAAHEHSDECSKGIVHTHVGTETIDAGCFYNGEVYKTENCQGVLEFVKNISYCDSCGGYYKEYRCTTCFKGYYCCGCDDVYYRTGSACNRVWKYYTATCGMIEGEYYTSEDMHKECTPCINCKDGTIYTKNILTSVDCPACSKSVSGEAVYLVIHFERYNSITDSYYTDRHVMTYIYRVDAHNSTGCYFQYNLGENVNIENVICKKYCKYMYGGGDLHSKYIVTNIDNSLANAGMVVCDKVVISIKPIR